jgi:hypothetical protein
MVTPAPHETVEYVTTTATRRFAPVVSTDGVVAVLFAVADAFVLPTSAIAPNEGDARLRASSRVSVRMFVFSFLVENRVSAEKSGRPIFAAARSE